MGRLSHLLEEFKSHEDTLHIWRARIFLTIFSSTILIGAISYVPNMKISFQSGDWLTASIYTIAYLVLISITFVRAIPFKIRVWTGVSVFYAIGLISFVTFGPIGSGRIWLLSFAVLSSMLLGLRAGLIAVLLNICTIFLLAIFLNTGYLEANLRSYSPSEYWLATGLSFVFLSSVVTISIGVLVNALEKNLKKEQSLSRELRMSNEQLERENTERRLAEESLRKSQERFKTLTNNLNVGIYRNTIGPEGKFLEANPAIVKMFGYESKNEFLAIKVSDLYKNPEKRKALNEKMLQKGFVRNEELLLRKKSGDSIICSVSSVAIKNENGNIKFYDGVIEDITERKRLESQFQQAQKMKAIGTLAGGVAHDLNNILSGIISYPELMLMDLPEDSPLIDSIKKIQKSGQKAAAIVQDLLTLARRGVSTAEIVNLNDIVSEYLTSPEFQKLITYHPIVKMETHLDSLLFNIMGSPVHLSKTVMNLVSNAAEAMAQGGKISIRTENKYLDRPIRNYDDIEEGDYVVLTVSDTGIGIADKEIGRIFEPFYTRRPDGQGTGLGLSISYRIIQEHHGAIHPFSEGNGKGSKFIVTLPLVKYDEEELKAA